MWLPPLCSARLVRPAVKKAQSRVQGVSFCGSPGKAGDLRLVSIVRLAQVSLCATRGRRCCIKHKETARQRAIAGRRSHQGQPLLAEAGTADNKAALEAAEAIADGGRHAVAVAFQRRVDAQGGAAQR